MGVVVALPDETGDVEQFLVDPPRRERRRRGLRVDVEVLAELSGPYERLVALRVRQGRGGAVPLAVGDDLDPVAGHQRDGRGVALFRGAALLRRRSRRLAADDGSLARVAAVRRAGR